MTIRLFIVLMCVAASPGASAQIFKSLDANGKVVYSDRPADHTVQVGVLKAAVIVPAYAQLEPPPAPAKPAEMNVAVLANPSDSRSLLAAKGLNAQGQVCARLMAENASAAKAARASFAVAAK
jgi:hypothetical protein